MSNQIQTWKEQNPLLVERGINESTWSSLMNTVYPGAKAESVMMVLDYCKARELDPMLKPVHIVPMSVKDSFSGKYGMRDVVMPGVGLYRIQASRSGDYAGSDEPEFGPIVNATLSGQNVAYPEWCKYTIHKLIGDRIVSFSAKEFWLENYATAGRDTEAPNAMWKKRQHGQIAKCAEAQALRKGWPEIGQDATAEEMAGKHYFTEEREINPAQTRQEKAIVGPAEYSQQSFNDNYPKWQKLIEAGKKTPGDIINMVSSKANLTETMIEQIEALKIEDAA